MIDYRILLTVLIIGAALYILAGFFIDRNKIFWPLMYTSLGLIVLSGVIWLLQIVWSLPS